MKDEDVTIIEVIKAARVIQEFLWSEVNSAYSLDEAKRMYRKRVAKIDAIDMSNPHWRVELRKRLLQTAAISVNLIHALDVGVEFSEKLPDSIKSNLPQYNEEVRP